MTRGVGLLCAALCCGFLLQGCGVYDAIWGRAESQKRVAAQRAPVSLRREDESKSAAGAARKLRMRVYATNRYASSSLDWQHQFERVIRDANPTLRTDFEIELEVAEYLAWADAGSEDSLRDLLTRLATKDQGGDVDWVLALATAVPELAESPDQLGLAATPGKHVVIRAMSDPQEFDAIERSFADLSASERAKLYATRKRHKAAIVLLHELGHTLGIPHEVEQDALMNARYSIRASNFSASAVRIARLELARRHAATAAPRVATPEARASDAAANVAPSVPDAALAGLSNDERRQYHAALAQKDVQNLSEAWRIAKPLFASHEGVYAVQKLRCDLATAIGGAWESIRNECAAFMKLPSPPP